MGAEIPELCGRKAVTNAVINPPIPPTITHGITEAAPPSGFMATAAKNLFQVKIAAAITIKSISPVLFIVPLIVIASEEYEKSL
jgi:hypothetical protein